MLIAGGAAGADPAEGALFRAWERSVWESDALAAAAARLARVEGDTEAVERAWERSDAADRTCDVATKRLLEARPASWGGLFGKAECVRWRMEACADRDLLGMLMGDVRRLAGA
ncbi:hypothetical protein TSO221_27965 [Azospirillum sp. TSO22-1]|nr:hypothetical protein TSO221_27965 [Azospirillum sp. TSO22-1]